MASIPSRASDPTPAPATLDRRQFLLAVSALAATGLLGGCTTADDAGPGPGVAGTTTPAGPIGRYELARRLRDLVGTSPDALEHRAADAVAARDVERIVGFVRDNITVLPTAGGRADPLTSTRWGTRGTLRAGAGTLRERADLMADLLDRAGFDATVKTAALPGSATDELLAKTRTPAFAIERKAIEALFAQAGMTIPAAVFEDHQLPPAIDADALLSLIPAAKRLPTETAGPTSTENGEVPVVEIKDGDRTQWAFAIAAGDTTTTKPADLRDIHAVPTPPVTLTVDVALNAQPGVSRDPLRVEQLLTATWPAADLAGRQVTLSFLPPGDPSLVAKVPPSAIDLRAPVFTVQGYPRETPPPAGGPGSSTTTVPPTSSPTTSTSTTSTTPPPGSTGGTARSTTTSTAPAGADADTLPRYGSIGTTLSRAGGLVALSADGKNPVSAYGEVHVLDESTRKAAAARVASIETTVHGDAYPTVTLDVALLDRDGTPVDGLSADDLVVTDNDKQQVVTLLSNTADTSVRVAVVFDTSGSVEWPTPEDRARFESTIGAALEQAAANQPFTVQVIGVGGLPTTTWKPATAAQIASDLAASGTVSSSVWDTLGRVAALGPSSIVYISDFVADDAPTTIQAAKDAIKGAQIPIVCIPVSKVDQAAVDAVTSLTPGLTLPGTDPDLGGKIGTFIGDHAKRVGRAGYRLRYRVLDDAAAPGPHAVNITLAGRDGVRGEARYEVPAVDQRAVPPGVGGIYLTIQHGSQISIRRLAGPPRDAGGVKRAPDLTHVAEVDAVLAGITTVVFEPGTPTTAAMLDDLLASFISLEPLEEPWNKGDIDAVLAASKDVRRVTGFQALLGLPDPEAERQASVTEGLTVTIVTETTTPEGIATVFDIAPELNRALPLAKDADGFGAAMARSLARSRIESALGATSAAAVLAKAPLQFVDAGVTNVAAFTEQQNAEWLDLLRLTASGLRLVPTDPKVHALWWIDPATGSCVAIDWSGRGGAMVYASDADCFAFILDIICAVINAWVLFICAQSAAAGAAGAFRCVGAATAGTFEKASTVLLLMAGAGGALTGFGSAVRDFAAGRILELGVGAGAGAAYGVLSNLYNAVGDAANCRGGR